MLELPGSAIPRLLTKSGAASSLPIPGLFQGGAGLDGTDLRPSDRLHTVLIDAVVRDVWAETSVTQTYKLEAEAPSDLVYLYPIDGDASVFDIAIAVNRRPIVCKMMEKIGSHTEFREVVDHGVAAVALEQVQGDIYCVHIGQVPPGAMVRCDIAAAASPSWPDSTLAVGHDVAAPSGSSPIVSPHPPFISSPTPPRHRHTIALIFGNHNKCKSHKRGVDQGDRLIQISSPVVHFIHPMR